MYYYCPFQFTNGGASRVGKCGRPCRNCRAASSIMYPLKLITNIGFAIKRIKKPIIRFSHYSEVEKDKVGSNTIESSSHIFRKWIRFASNVIII